jgi:small neutral amino acid transporter SnatA (MarC family)
MLPLTCGEAVLHFVIPCALFICSLFVWLRLRCSVFNIRTVAAAPVRVYKRAAGFSAGFSFDKITETGLNSS